MSREEALLTAVISLANVIAGDYMRNPTEEESKSVNDYIDSISRPTGVNIFDELERKDNE